MTMGDGTRDGIDGLLGALKDAGDLRPGLNTVDFRIASLERTARDLLRGQQRMPAAISMLHDDWMAIRAAMHRRTGQGSPAETYMGVPLLVFASEEALRADAIVREERGEFVVWMRRNDTREAGA